MKNKLKDVRFVRTSAIVASGLLIASYVLMLSVLFKIQLIPIKYFGLLFLVMTIATALVVYLLLKSAAPMKRTIVLIMVAIGMILANIGVFSFGVITNNFLGAIQQPAESYEEYSIVALKANAVALDASGQAIGVLSGDTNAAAVTTEVGKKTPAAITTIDNPTAMILALDAGDAQMAVFKSSYVTLLQETANNELYQRLQVLATFRVKVSQSAAVAAIDMTKPFAVYISGIDTYGAIATASRSDVNILAVVNPVTHKILLVNTPRDYYVQLHGTTGTRDKLTHAGIYGVDTSVATMEDLYGIDINYNVRINFSSLVRIVNTLGGVNVTSEYNFSAQGHQFAIGSNNLNGEQALAFSRDRKSFDGGDRTRGANQMRVIQAIIAKLSSPSTIINYQSIMASLQDGFQTNLSQADIAALSRNQLDTMATWQTTSISVDGAGATNVTYSMGNTPLYVMEPDQASLDNAKATIKRFLAH